MKNKKDNNMKNLMKSAIIATSVAMTVPSQAGGVEKYFLGLVVAYSANCYEVQDKSAFQLKLATELVSSDITVEELSAHSDFKLGYKSGLKGTCTEIAESMVATDKLAVEVIFNL